MTNSQEEMAVNSNNLWVAYIIDLSIFYSSYNKYIKGIKGNYDLNEKIDKDSQQRNGKLKVKILEQKSK